MMTELAELKANWEEYSRKLDESLRLNRETLSAGKLKAAESEVRRMAIWAGCEAGMWLSIVVALGNFIAGHIGTPALAFSAAAVDVASIGMTIALMRRMVGALRLDYSQPVTAIQRDVEELQVLRIRTTQYGVLWGTMLWVPCLAVALQVLLGVNLYSVAAAPWLIANGLFGLTLLLVAIWLARKYGDRAGRFPLIRRLMKDLAGNNLNAAQGFLATLREFERE